MKKKLLFAYDCMMVGGTTTALLSLLRALDYTQYEVDLLLYRNEGPLMDCIPPQVNLLPEAATPSCLPDTVRKLWRSVWNGQVFRAAYYAVKNRCDPAKRSRMILWQATERAHAAISRRVSGHYDAAIGFIESWGAHYAVSDRVKADRRIVWIHLDVNKSYLIPALDRPLYRRADAIVTVSEECRAHLAAKLPRRTKEPVCIENILEADEVRRKAQHEAAVTLDRGGVKLISVCRIVYSHKGLDRGLVAFKRLKDEGLLRGIHWFWVGDGPDLSAARRYVEDNGLQEWVTFLGQQLEPLPLVKQCDLFFLPSRYEGKPMAVTEAQMVGLPCVVTAYASAAEQVEDGKDGLILENSDEAVYGFLKGLCAGEYPVEQWRQAVAVKDFSTAAIMEKVEALWNGCKA